MLLDAATGAPAVPNGSSGFRFTDAGAGKWNLELGDVDPLLTLLDDGAARPSSCCCHASTPRTAPPGCCVAGCRCAGSPARLVTTVFDLLLRAVRRGTGRGCRASGRPAYDDATQPYTPAWQEEITSVPAAAAARIGREFAANAEASGGRSMIVMGAGTNHWFHSDTIYRAFLDPDHADRLPGRQRRRLGALRRARRRAAR